MPAGLGVALLVAFGWWATLVWPATRNLRFVCLAIVLSITLAVARAVPDPTGYIAALAVAGCWAAGLLWPQWLGLSSLPRPEVDFDERFRRIRERVRVTSTSDREKLKRAYADATAALQSLEPPTDEWSRVRDLEARSLTLWLAWETSDETDLATKEQAGRAESEARRFWTWVRERNTLKWPMRAGRERSYDLELRDLLAWVRDALKASRSAVASDAREPFLRAARVAIEDIRRSHPPTAAWARIRDDLVTLLQIELRDHCGAATEAEIAAYRDRSARLRATWEGVESVN